ncbi:MAG: 2-oxoglutarate dehydrogenase E1 component, partial [Phycisphaerales bacterium]|nr:2-oxoglutarate dehydrogenase E1 component [Phycisphaerales bacterium]
FGDFANGAQVIIDQFIASAEAKWHRWSGLTLLLPHGYEGQGPEHSSCRIERFLKLCGDRNIQVCNPTTPAQYFHMLRRQVKTPYRKPLIVATPKSLLRLPAASSRISEFTGGAFQCIIDDPMFSDGSRDDVKRVLLCSGKVFYDLEKRREETGRSDTAIVRVEQLYPFDAERFHEIRKAYPKDAEYIWVQEEPKNMGPFGHMTLTLMDLGYGPLTYIGRPISSTPATGSPRLHARQLEAFLTDAIGAKQPAEAEVA